MDLKIDEEIVKEMIRKNGRNIEQIVCMEECAELQQAISKSLRGKLNYANLVEEMADVLICITMLQKICGIPDTKLQAMINMKQEREKVRLKKYEN